MAIMKCMKYDRVDPELDSKEMPKIVFIGYIDEIYLGNVEYKHENLFSLRSGGVISLSCDPTIVINRIGLRNFK